MDPPAGVIFDMDGLLLDTERLALAAFEAACRDLQLQVPADLYRSCIGSNAADTRRILEAALGGADCRRLDDTWRQHYQGAIDAGQVVCKPGAAELLGALAARGIPRALATSTVRATALGKLRATGLIDHFAVLVCGGETARGKPHPDPYLAAAQALDVPPARAWALEDSENGVRSALAAGLVVFQVPDLVPPSPELLALGHRVLPDLGAVHDLLCG